MTVYKMIEVVGTSGTSIDDAIRGAIERASSSVEDLQWFEVKEIRGRIDEANRAEFQVKVNIGFVVHAPKNPVGAKTARVGRELASRQTRSTAAQIAAKGGERRRTDIARSFQKQKRK